MCTPVFHKNTFHTVHSKGVFALACAVLCIVLCSCFGNDSDDNKGTIAVHNISSDYVITKIWLGSRLHEYDTDNTDFVLQVSDAGINPSSDYYFDVDEGWYALQISYKSYDKTTLLPTGAEKACKTLVKYLDSDDVLDATFNGTACGWQ